MHFGAGVDEQLAREIAEEVAELRHHPSRTEVGTTLTLSLWFAAGNLVLTAIIFLHIFTFG